MKRQKTQDQNKSVQYYQGDSDDSQNDYNIQEKGESSRYVNMPKKNKHRMRAHINPMNEITIPVPKNPNYAQWKLHYPSFFGSQDNNQDRIVVNTGKYKINEYNENPQTQFNKVPTILDIGCGYGGLMFALSPSFPEQLILGQEIRDKVSNYVAEKVNSLRINTQYKDCLNVAVVRTNTMKTFQNYFGKDSLSKIFICFADPHFKKVNHRRRIITQQLLTDYAYCLKPGGRLYEVTDVKDLHDWNCSHLEQHQMFERVAEPVDDEGKQVTQKQGVQVDQKEEEEDQICVKAMREGTDEAHKVIRNGGKIWHAIYRKRDFQNNQKLKQHLDQQFLESYFL